MLKRILFIVLISLSLSSCYLPQGRFYYNDRKIVGETNSYTYSNRIGDIEEDGISLDISFTGLDTMWKIEVLEDTELNCSYEANITSGEFKIILVSPDKEITSTIEGDFDGDIVLDLKKGENIVKIAGNDAEGSFKLSVIDEDLDNITIKPITKEKWPFE